MTKNAEVVPIKKLDKQAAINELAAVNWPFANALSGKNPPYTPETKKPGPNAGVIVFGFVIPGCLVFFWFVEMLFGASMFLLSGMFIAFGIITVISWVIAWFIKDNQPEYYPPPPPTLFILHPIHKDFSKQWRGRQLTVSLRYDIPTATDQAHAGPLLSMLTLEVEDTLDKLLSQAQKRYSVATDEQKALLDEQPIDMDELEYLVTPGFGRIVFESQILVFRYRFTTKMEVPPPPEKPAPRQRGFVGSSQ